MVEKEKGMKRKEIFLYFLFMFINMTNKVGDKNK